MTKFKDNNYKFWYSPMMLVVFFCVLVLFIYNTVGLIKKERQTANRKELVQDQIESLNKRKSSLEGDISNLETEEGKEEIIREKYQVAKEGEKMVIIVDNENNVDSLKEEEIVDRHGFWNWVKRIFKRN